MAVYKIDILLFLRHGIATQFSQKDRDFPIVSSGCMMMSKALYLELGGQDELCMNIHCDVDLAFRVLKKVIGIVCVQRQKFSSRPNIRTY